MTIKPSLLAMMLTLGLAACGGSGTSTDSGSYQNKIALSAAWHDYLTASGNWSGTATGSDGKTYVYTVTTAPGADQAFPMTGQTGHTMRRSAMLTAGGAPVASDTRTTYFNNDMPFGVVNGNGSCSLLPAAPALPALVGIPANGLLPQSTDFSSCDPGAPAAGLTTTSWYVEFDGFTPMLCLKTESTEAVSAFGVSETNCFGLQPDGTMTTTASFTLTVNGQTLTFRSA